MAAFILFSAFGLKKEHYPNEHIYKTLTATTDPLKKEALKILKTKCNMCHKKQNPFMIFNERNMVKRAPKIYQMVYIDRKMPKGDDIKLTNEEYIALEKWLLTQNIY